VIVIKGFAVKFEFEAFKVKLGLNGLEIKNPPFRYSAILKNGSDLPDYFIID